MSAELNKDMQEFISMMDYHHKFHDTTGLDITLGILNKHKDELKISDEAKAELNSAIEVASDLNVLPAQITDMLSMEGAKQLIEINSSVRKELGMPIKPSQETIKAVEEEMSAKEVEVKAEEVPDITPLGKNAEIASQSVQSVATSVSEGELIPERTEVVDDSIVVPETTETIDVSSLTADLNNMVVNAEDFFGPEVAPEEMTEVRTR